MAAPQDVEVGISENPPPPAYGSSEVMGTAAPEAAPPPAYNIAARRQDAPPSYNSLFGKMKDAKRDSNNPVDYLKRAFQLLLSTAIVSIFLVVSLAIPIAMIAVGGIYFTRCPIDHRIPIFLVVMGGVSIMKNLSDLRNRYKYPGGREDEVRHRKEYEGFISHLMGCFLFVFFITGNVWVYGIYRVVNTTDPEQEEDYCHPVLYYFSFWIITVIYIVCGLGCCCVCCTVGAAATTAQDDDEEES
ncbi:transmembrane protein 272-like [Diadema setosum]|uniref:transmembrane protein 272-like n=1 Tax=Diadema setosum TaxID=31175 RepID=UPI003B3AB4C8